MPRAFIVVALALVAGCKRASEDAPNRAPPAPQVAPPAVPPAINRAAAAPTLACVIEAEGGDAMYVPAEMARFAPVDLVRMAAKLAIERARADGPGKLDEVLRYEAEVLWGLDDVDGMREVFALIDADPKRRLTNDFTYGGPQRARAGIPPNDGELARDPVVIARELALAGNRDHALKLLAAVTDAELGRPDTLRAFIGALAATGQGKRARTLIEAQPREGYRVKLAGAWLETALRAGGSIAEPLAVLLAEIRTGTDGDVWRLDASAVIRRARIVHREREIVPMIDALRPRYAALFHTPRSTNDAYEIAVETGEVAPILAVGALPADLAQRVEVARGPLDRAFAAAQQLQELPALLHVWVRWLAAGAEPILGAKLSAALCPAASRTPATPPIGVLTATQIPRRKQTTCAPHDVVLTLTVKGTVRVTRTLEGDCSGACTPARKREGAAEKERIEREIADGLADPAAANYSFTGCSFVGFDLDGVDDDEDAADDRQIVYLRERYQEAHDVDVTRPRIAFEVCGDIYISDPIWVASDEPWIDPSLRVDVEPDLLVVRAVTDKGSNVVLRLALPTCPGVPTVVK